MSPLPKAKLFEKGQKYTFVNDRVNTEENQFSNWEDSNITGLTELQKTLSPRKPKKMKSMAKA